MSVASTRSCDAEFQMTLARGVLLALRLLLLLLLLEAER
jgi:hypothetical protein